jgi:hypothetical protein
MNLDVTQLVQTMTSTPAGNYGFELKLTNETYYAQMIFASGDNPHPDKHPLLEVCYTIGTGIDNFTSATSVSVSPNPAFEILNVRLPENVRGVKYRIHDAIGKLICEESGLTSRSSMGNSIDISGLQAGIYFLQLRVDNQIVTRKFLKD